MSNDFLNAKWYKSLLNGYLIMQKRTYTWLWIVFISLVIQNGCKSPTDRTIDKAYKLIESSIIKKKLRGIKLLEEDGSEEAVNELLKLMRNKSVYIRMHAIKSYVNLRQQNSLSALIDLLSIENDPQNLKLIAYYIKQFSEKDYNYLIKQLDTLNNTRKLNVLKAMALVKDPLYIKFIGEMLENSKEYKIQKQSVEALCLFDHIIAAEFLHEAL